MTHLRGRASHQVPIRTASSGKTRNPNRIRRRCSSPRVHSEPANCSHQAATSASRSCSIDHAANSPLAQKISVNPNITNPGGPAPTVVAPLSPPQPIPPGGK